jgi:hypothetical protein
MTTTTAAPTRITATFSAELAKLWSLRTSRAMLAAALVLAALTAVLFCTTMGPTTGIPLEHRPPHDVVTTSLFGVDAAALVLIVLVAGAIGSEYANGMIRTTLTATPRRMRYLVAKAASIALVALVVGVLAAVVSFGTGQLILVAAGLPTASPVDPVNVRLLLGTALAVPFYATVALAFSVIFRNTAGGVVAGLAVLALPTLFGWLGPWAQSSVVPLLPTSAIHSIAGLTPAADAGYLAPPLALLVLAVWAVAALALALRLLTSRDA